MIVVVEPFKQASGCRSLIVVTLLLIKCSYVVTNGIICATGAAKAFKVPISYTIREQFITPFGCFHGFSTESKLWPGTPANFVANVSTADGSFQLSWKPPDDSSASTLKGFLLTMYVEETGQTNSIGPSMCYIVDSKTAQGNKPTNGVTQDAVFHMDCKMPRKLNVKVKLIALPVPLERNFKEAAIDVIFKGTTTISSTTRPNPVTKMLTKPPADKLESTTMFAISLGAVFVCVIVSTVVVFLLCKTRCSSHGIIGSNINNMSRNTQRINKHCISSSRKETSNDIRKERTEIIERDERDTVYVYGIPDADHTVQEKFENLCSEDDERADTISYNYHYDRGDFVPIPEPFRTQLEMINLKS